MSAVLNLDHHETLHYNHAARELDEMDSMQIRERIVTANNCGKLLGNGSYGHVYEIDKTDNVLKVCTPRELKSDGYHLFLKLPMSLSNPFFPRVERFVKYQGNDGGIVYGVKMERLYSFAETEPFYLRKLGRSLINDFDTGNYASDNDPGYTLAYRIKEIYSEVYSNGTSPKIKDLDLISALKDIAIVHKKHGLCNDMGKPNFMIRQTLNWNTLSTDCHFVITDPLA